jgi:nucleotide-binding universal stress UspA family protein
MSIFPTKILLATDGSEDAQLAATTALDLSKRLDSDLHVLYVGHLPSVLYESPGPLMLDPGFESRMRERAEEDANTKLEEQVQKIKQAGGQVEGSHLRVGRPDAEIVAQAEEIGAGLIVMGSRGFGAIRRTLTGSVSDSVVRHAHCPVVVVRGEPVVFPTKILFATDASREAELAATTAAELVKATASELQAVHVNPQYVYARAVRTAETEEVARKVLEEQVDHLRTEGVDVAEAHLRVGQPATVIVALAEDMAAGLIVVGSRGLGAIRRALSGSVSDAVVRHAHCPVMVVRPEK